MQSKRVPVFSIDLNLQESHRWDKVIDASTNIALKLAEVAESNYEGVPTAMRIYVRGLLSAQYRMAGSWYKKELKAWGAALNRSLTDMVALNCAYELSHLAEVLHPEPGTGLARSIGCTTGVHRFPNFGMVHVRNLDWALPVGRGTCVFEFVKDERRFVVVGILGYVGALSGMLPGAYSAVINSAPPDGRPNFTLTPAVLLRRVLETCDTYEEAVYRLSRTKLATSVFFTVCGVKEACVIERTKKKAVIRKYNGTPIVQANHHVAKEFLHSNRMTMSTETLRDSRERVSTLRNNLRAMPKTRSLKKIASCLDIEPVLSWETEQQMVFCPEKGRLHVWRRRASQ